MKLVLNFFYIHCTFLKIFGHLTTFIVFLFRRKCLEGGKLVSKSGVLDKALSKILTHGNQVSGVEFKTYQEGIYTIVVFAAPSCRLDSSLTLLSGPKERNPFHFVCSENVSSIYLHTPAYQLFVSACQNNLNELKSEVVFSSTLLSLSNCLQAKQIYMKLLFTLLSLC